VEKQSKLSRKHRRHQRPRAGQRGERLLEVRTIGERVAAVERTPQRVEGGLLLPPGRVAILHNLGDALSNIAIIIGALMIRRTGQPVIDPILAFLIAGMILHPRAAAPELIRFYRDFIRDAPDEVGGALALVTAPPADFVPGHARGKPACGVVVVYLGEE